MNTKLITNIYNYTYLNLLIPQFDAPSMHRISWTCSRGNITLDYKFQLI